MKKILLILIFITSLVSCEPCSAPQKNVSNFKPNIKIYDSFYNNQHYSEEFSIIEINGIKYVKIRGISGGLALAPIIDSTYFYKQTKNLETIINQQQEILKQLKQMKENSSY